MSQDEANPKYPLYIPSKSRAESRLTVKALESMNVPFHVVIEEAQWDSYAAVIDEKKLLVLPERYFDEYDPCDEFGRTKSLAPGPARNFIWDHSVERGFKRHWVMDDNIWYFCRYNLNKKTPARTGAVFRAMEDFCDRYTNVAMAGPQYYMFIPRKALHPPFSMNTRIYSCNLIKNDVPFRWRGRYNEDTDLSLRMLKAGYCTIQFNAFLQFKMPTQTVKGGNTEAFYAKEGTYLKSEMQVRLHPDVSKMVHRFSRIHHYVDYGPFKRNRLIKCEDAIVAEEPNEYGMKLYKKVPK